MPKSVGRHWAMAAELSVHCADHSSANGRFENNCETRPPPPPREGRRLVDGSPAAAPINTGTETNALGEKGRTSFGSPGAPPGPTLGVPAATKPGPRPTEALGEPKWWLTMARSTTLNLRPRPMERIRPQTRLTESLRVTHAATLGLVGKRLRAAPPPPTGQHSWNLAE